jgi:hypothetical protein
MLCMESSSLPSLNGSGKGPTEKGETGTTHFIGTTRCLPSDAESTDLLDFVVVLDVSGRCGAFLMRSSNSSFPLVQFENPLSCAAEVSSVFRSKQMALLESMYKGTVFVSICCHQRSCLSRLVRLGTETSQWLPKSRDSFDLSEKPQTIMWYGAERPLLRIAA